MQIASPSGLDRRRTYLWGHSRPWPGHPFVGPYGSHRGRVNHEVPLALIQRPPYQLPLAHCLLPEPYSSTDRVPFNFVRVSHVCYISIQILARTSVSRKHILIRSWWAMPIRRASASAGHTTPSSSRAHRSNDSHHGLGNGLTQPPSVAYSAASATPQQKNVQALINRIKNKVRSLRAHSSPPNYSLLAPRQLWSCFGRSRRRSSNSRCRRRPCRACL